MKGKSNDGCGCALGAKCMAVAFALSFSYYTWQGLSGLAKTSFVILRILEISFFAAGAGKIAGIIMFHVRKKNLNKG